LREDAGQVMPLAVALLVLAMVLVLATVPLARGARERAAAQTAADAAALAGVNGGEPAARAVAAANDAEVVSYTALAGEVWVVVTYGEATARARARLEAVP
jgi:cytochrome oxidase Cu insertion factor (SCO1/SenC/PrrC family)